ncbi:alpha/beta fold hydrolase [Streptomyces alkaliphilus]|uniref:Alpha/beta fold hydrolase n=1 Tax=Streptomyces alkaliphilus TaxID=1472722 RepID=A0A7W3TBH7_9ACTN|nr:alpha/beta fold hydrolase [Streptomyces alkaliphilus]MBB0243743.1 alpha/beta fold hydrolase [Streptomyces alkaliphilus]
MSDARTERGTAGIECRRFDVAGPMGRLSGRLELPEGRPPVAYAVFAHCFTCGKDILAAARVSRGLARLGWGVLRFDFAGIGESEGDFSRTGFGTMVEDLVHTADGLREAAAAPALLVGHSMGGGVALAAAHRIPEVRAVATIAAPADPAHLRGQLPPGTEEELRRDGEADVTLAGRPFRMRREFLDDLVERSREQRGLIAGLDAALLVLHSPVDSVVGVEEAGELFSAARHPKAFIGLDGADHLLGDASDAAWVAGLVDTWARRWVHGD